MRSAFVIRTDRCWDNLVKHLGYTPLDISQEGSESGETMITDRALIKTSQERLRRAKAVPDDKLEPRHLAHLKLARGIAARVFHTPPPVHAAVIPAASVLVRTAGMYSTKTSEVYISLETMERAKSMVDTLVHELAHHRQFRSFGEAEDLTPAHAEAMAEIAAEVVQAVSSGILDDLLKEVTW